MNRWLLSFLLLVLTNISFADDTEQADAPAESESLPAETGPASLFPQGGQAPTETITVEMLSDEAFKESVRRLPQLMERIRVESFAADNPYVLIHHRPNYILPVAWYSHPGEHTDISFNENAQAVTETADYGHFEAVFQLSIKYPVAKGVIGDMSRLEVAYTNRSFWQMYNSDISRPFRETNHEPELILSWLPQNKKIDYFSVALNHHSNGQSGDLSRSWNRVIAETGVVFPNGLLNTKIWWRIPETSRVGPLGDDNPDITHFMGHGEVRYVFVHGRNTASVMLRNNLKTSNNKGAIELGYNFPLHKKIKGYIHYFNGYGESLIDYDRNQQRIAIGIKLSDWL